MLKENVSSVRRNVRLSLAVTAVVAAVCGCGRDENALTVPERHRPLTFMGRDCWRMLHKYNYHHYRSWRHYHTWGKNVPMDSVRIDDPSLLKLPAFTDVAYSYIAEAESPAPETGSSVHYSYVDNFVSTEPDREIAVSNPDPDRPFFVVNRRERVNKAGWGTPVVYDRKEYAAWRAAHPNILVDGGCGEWCGDIMAAYSYLKREKAKKNSPARLKQLETLEKFLYPKPTNRYEMVEMLKRYFKMRREHYYDGKMYVLDAHINSLHLAGDIGASLVSLETTCSGRYRYRCSSMFARGASRQFGIPWMWYIAVFANAFAENGDFLGDAVCSHPVEAKTDLPHYGKLIDMPGWPNGKARIWNEGVDFGMSDSLFKRTHYLSYVSGANFIQLEEWARQCLSWSDKAGKTVLTPRGKIYSAFADFVKKHPRRGTHYSPVAICVPIAQGYPTWGGSPWERGEFGYTEGDKAVDVVFHTLDPARPYIKTLRQGVENYLRNSPYASMYDVITPDAESQSPEELLDVMKSYRALVVVGDYRDVAWKETLAAYEAQGGRVIHVGAEDLSESVGTGSLATGGVRYPRVERLFAELQRDYFPFKVEGDCLYGLTVDDGHAWLYVLNNEGVTKFADIAQKVDESKAVRVRVSAKKSCPAFKGVKELLSGRTVGTAGGSFSWTVPTGDLAIFELEMK